MESAEPTHRRSEEDGTHPTGRPVRRAETSAAARGRAARRDGAAAGLRLAISLLVATMLAWTGTAVAQVAVTDDLGREVQLERPAQRVVSMMPSHTETVCALDACDALVGRDTFSNVPERVLSLPDLGSAFSADLEALIALEPDLVLTDEFSGLAEALEPLGIPVYAGIPQTIEDVWEVMEEVGTLLGRETRAAVVIGRAQGRIEALADRARSLPRVSVYYELDATPYSAGPESFIGRLLSVAGGENIVPASLGEFPQLDPEMILEADPDAILLADAPYGETAESLSDRPGWSDLRALRNDRVLELTQDQVDLLNRAGPRLAEALELLIELLHPEVR